MSVWKYKDLPINKMFVDAGDAKIFVCTEENPKGERIAHRNGAGYQRDPWTRIGWVNVRADNFDDKVCRPLEVSERNDGTYAVIDGGGRWLMAQRLGLEKLSCRVHTGLSRSAEAKLFTMFDDSYKLRGIQLFVARVRAGSVVAVQIANAVKPYKVAERGKGTLRCVNTLVEMYVAYGNDTAKGIKLIERTCKLAAAGWSGFTEGGEVQGGQIDQRMISALGLIIDHMGSKLDETVLLKVMEKHPAKQLQKHIELTHGKPLGDHTTLFAAKQIARYYNRHFVGSATHKIDLQEIDECALWESMEEGKTFAALLRESEMEAAALVPAEAAE